VSILDVGAVSKVIAILAKLRLDAPVTLAGVDLRRAMDRTILALDRYRTEAASTPPADAPPA
jgi:hypothetical protein